jgi:hypothetical protein
MIRVWHRERSMTFWRHDLLSAARMPPVFRSRFWRYRFRMVPMVWWGVEGRKMFATQHSKRIRASWKIGAYGRQ